MWKKIWLFTRSCFHEGFLEFQSYSKEIISMFVQNKIVLENSSDSHGYGCISVGKFCSAFGEVK